MPKRKDIASIKDYQNKQCKEIRCITALIPTMHCIEEELQALKHRKEWNECKHRKECLQELLLYFVSNINKYL